ncbi:MAG: RluA family pseudouridine synthase [Oscillospiraceae bacterium]|nr:RluA family pseudouridine synthase [Oscillospiraceae bacterium]
MEIKLLYADNDIVVCLKPLGKDSEKDMPDILQTQLKNSEVYCVHRLDMAVGGVMVYALNKKAAAGLSRQIAEQQMKKEYLAIVQGCPEEKSGILRDLLFRDRAKNKSYVVKRRRAGVKDAELEFECVEQAGDKSLLHIVLHTGRSHQIRVQFSSRKMPLVGDVKYGSSYKDCPISLWSHALSFRHPTSGKAMHFEHLPEAEYYWKEFEYIKGEV